MNIAVSFWSLEAGGTVGFSSEPSMNFYLLILELLVESQLVTLFFNYLSLLEQVIHKYVWCGRLWKVIAISFNAIEIVLYQ